MLSTRGIETRSAKLVAAVVAVLALATAIIVLSSARADALPCDPQVQDCNSGGGTSTIRVTLSVTNNQPDRGKITSSDNRINCGLGNTDCSQLYSYTVTCDGLGDCSTPDYATVSLSPTSASGLALSAWGGACSGAGSCSVTMDASKTVSASFADTQNPTMSLGSPLSNAVVRGTMNLSASASDNVGVGQVSFFYGSSFVGSDSSQPYALSVNSATRPDGRHTVGARAVDTSGRQSILVLRPVIVDNHAPAVLDTAAGLEPDRGVRNASRTADISAAFSEEMAQGTLTSSTVKLQVHNKMKKWTTVPTTLGMAEGNTRVILDPFGATEGDTSERALGANKKHRVIITTGARDIAAHAMTSDFVWNFNTGSS